MRERERHAMIWIDYMAGSKKCSKCGETKELSEFPRTDSGKLGVSSWCRKCSNKSTREWRKRNLEHANMLSRKRYRELRREVLEHYGGVCQCPKCGETRNEFLAIDHINGGGAKERKTAGYGSEFYRWLKRSGWPSGYRVLCHNCNMAIGLYGYCPHEKVDDAR